MPTGANRQVNADIDVFLRQQSDNLPMLSLQTLVQLYRLEYPSDPRKDTALTMAIKRRLRPTATRPITYVDGVEPLPDKKTTLELRRNSRREKPTVDVPAGKWLVLSDIHIPYHDSESLEIAINHGVRANVTGIYLNGDLVDFYQISRFSKDPARMGIREEIELVNTFLDDLRKLGLPIYWKLGNHEDRWIAFLQERVPALMGLPSMAMEKQFATESVTMVGSKTIAVMGGLLVIHGHEFGSSFFNPVNPARGLFLRSKTSVLAGHNHQTSSHHESNLRGSAIACFSTGCLCDMMPEYMPFGFTKWNHGFAIVTHDGDKKFNVENFRILEDGTVV
jgi:predicted phosphodiesterase